MDAGASLAGKGDHLDPLVADEGIADDRARAEHAPENPIRQVRLSSQQRQRLDGDSRGQARRFHDRGVPRSERRSKRTNEQRQGPVPRSDHGHHADGFAKDDAGDLRPEHGRAAVDGACEAGVVVDHPRRPGELDPCLVDRLPLLARQQLCEPL